MTIRVLAAAFVVAVCSCARAADPADVNWRGDGTGTYDAQPPAEWSATKNVAWKMPLPSWSNASPVVSGKSGRVFVTSEPTDLVCVDGAGKALWSRSHPLADVMTDADKAQADRDKPIAEGLRAKLPATEKRLTTVMVEIRRVTPAATQADALATQPDLPARLTAMKTEAEELKGRIATMQKELSQVTRWEPAATNEAAGDASATPFVTGDRVFAVFGNGVAASYDMEGQRQWVRFVDKPGTTDGQSASPVLHGGKLLVHLANLTALDPTTGRTLWEARDTAPGFGTPVVVAMGKTDVVVTPSGDVVRLADGEVLARKVSNVSYCSPVVADGVAYFVQNTSKAQGGGHAVRMNLSDGVLTAKALWVTKPARDRYYASPRIDGERIYAVNQAGAFSVISRADGSVVSELKLDLGSTFYASVCQAGGRLFVCSETGKTAELSVDAGGRASVVRVNELEPFRCTPAFVGGRVYVRTLKSLYCIGQK